MKTFLKVLGIVVLVVVALIAAFVGWAMVRQPSQRPASAEKIEATPARLARGKYLVHHVSECVGCHSHHTEGYAYPVKPGAEAIGGDFAWDESIGFPGKLVAPNITPDPETGIGNWTDGEVLRAIREGVAKDGKALFPIMPYPHFASMSDEDAKSIVVYLRTLKPVRNQVQAKVLNPPVNVIEKFIPKPLEAPVPDPDPSNRVAYGKYLATIGGCYECHTPHDNKGPIAAEAYSGGWEMKGPWGRVVTSNITPHPDTFLGRATKEEFIGRFRAQYDPTAKVPKGRNTVMPWTAFSGMTDEDLGAIYDYLKTVKPIEKKVNAFPDAG